MIALEGFGVVSAYGITLRWDHLCGVLLLLGFGNQTWHATYPSMDREKLRADLADLFRWASDDAKGKYGTAFVVTANLDSAAHEYFPDLGRYLDAGYYQNALFEWNGSARVMGYVKAHYRPMRRHGAICEDAARHRGAC